MDRMIERAIDSLVERGKMTPEEAVVKRADLLPASALDEPQMGDDGQGESRA